MGPLRLRHAFPVGDGLAHFAGNPTSPTSASPPARDAREVRRTRPLAFVAFQATFAIITVALISGAIADRAKFGAWMIFAGIWATLVYFPVATWVFGAAAGS